MPGRGRHLQVLAHLVNVVALIQQFSPSRRLRIVCSGVCRRLAMIVKSSYAHPRASDSHKHWHHLQGPSHYQHNLI